MVVGVNAPVRRLAQVRSVRRLRTLRLGVPLAELHRVQPHPALLPDLFFTRLAGVVADRDPELSVVQSLLKEAGGGGFAASRS